MVLLRLTVKILPPQHVGESLGPLSGLADHNNGNLKVTSFLMVLHKPEQVTLGELAWMISEKWRKLRPNVDPLGIKNLFDDEHDTGVLDADFTVADVFVDHGRASVDGLDQRATLRVVQKPVEQPPIRYGSVGEDWNAVASHYERIKAVKAELPVPVLEGGAVRDHWTLDVKTPGYTDVYGKSEGEPRGSVFRRFSLPKISDSDRPVMSVEADEPEFAGSRKHGEMSPVLVEDSQAENEAQRNDPVPHRFSNEANASIPQSAISLRQPNLSAPVAGLGDIKPKASPQNIASASALVAEIQTSLAEQMEALAALPQLQPTKEVSAGGKGPPSKSVSKLTRRVTTGQLSNPRTQLMKKSLDSKKRRASNNGDFWGYISSDHEDVSAAGPLPRPSKRRNVSQREVSVIRVIEPMQSSAERKREPTDVGSKKMGSANSRQQKKSSAKLNVDKHLGLKLSPSPAVRQMRRVEFKGPGRKSTSVFIDLDDIDQPEKPGDLSALATRGSNKTHNTDRIDSDIEMIDAPGNGKAFERNQENHSAVLKSGKRAGNSVKSPNMTVEVPHHTQTREPREEASSEAKEGRSRYETVSDGESDNSTTRFTLPRRKLVDSGNTPIKKNPQSTPGKSVLNDAVQNKDKGLATTNQGVNIVNLASASLRVNAPQDPKPNQVGLGIIKSPPKQKPALLSKTPPPPVPNGGSSTSKEGLSKTSLTPAVTILNSTGRRDSLSQLKAAPSDSITNPQTPGSPAVRPVHKGSPGSGTEQRSVSFAKQPEVIKPSAPVPVPATKRRPSLYPPDVSQERLECIRSRAVEIDAAKRQGATEEHIGLIKTVHQLEDEIRLSKQGGKNPSKRLRAKLKLARKALGEQSSGFGERNVTEGQASKVVDSSASVANKQARLKPQTDVPDRQGAESGSWIQNPENSAIAVSSSPRNATSTPQSGRSPPVLNNKNVSLAVKVGEGIASIPEPRLFKRKSQTQLPLSKPHGATTQGKDAKPPGSRDILFDSNSKNGNTPDHLTTSSDSESDAELSNSEVDTQVRVGKADKSEKQISAETQEEESPPRKLLEATPSRGSKLSVMAKETSQRVVPEDMDSEIGLPSDSSGSESNSVPNRISNSKSNPESDGDSNSDSVSSGSSLSFRNSIRPKHRIPGVRPQDKRGDIDDAADTLVAMAAGAPLGQVKHQLKSSSQPTNMQSISPTASESDSAGVRKSESRATLKSLKHTGGRKPSGWLSWMI